MQNSSIDNNFCFGWEWGKNAKIHAQFIALIKWNSSKKVAWAHIQSVWFFLSACVSLERTHILLWQLPYGFCMHSYLCTIEVTANSPMIFLYLYETGRKVLTHTKYYTNIRMIQIGISFGLDWILFFFFFLFLVQMYQNIQSIDKMRNQFNGPMRLRSSQVKRTRIKSQIKIFVGKQSSVCLCVSFSECKQFVLFLLSFYFCV